MTEENRREQKNRTIFSSQRTCQRKERKEIEEKAINKLREEEKREASEKKVINSARNTLPRLFIRQLNNFVVPEYSVATISYRHYNYTERKKHHLAGLQCFYALFRA